MPSISAAIVWPTPDRSDPSGVAAVTFANGADNISIYVPFFAAAGADGMAVIAIVFTALVAVWCLAGPPGHPPGHG